MSFNENSYRRRLIESHKNSRGKVGVYLRELAVQGAIELVPDTCYEDEQGMDCEATFRHSSGAYLLYARRLDAEQLDIAVPRKFANQISVGEIREMLRRDLGDLLSPLIDINDFVKI